MNSSYTNNYVIGQFLNSQVSNWSMWESTTTDWKCLVGKVCLRASLRLVHFLYDEGTRNISTPPWMECYSAIHRYRYMQYTKYLPDKSNYMPWLVDGLLEMSVIQLMLARGQVWVNHIIYQMNNWVVMLNIHQEQHCLHQCLPQKSCILQVIKWTRPGLVATAIAYTLI